MTYKDKLLAASSVHSRSPNQSSSKSLPLCLVTDSYWSLACGDPVPSAGDSPVSKPKRTRLSEENKQTAIQETKLQPLSLYLLNCTWRSRVFKRSHFQSLLSIQLLCLESQFCHKRESRPSHFISSYSATTSNVKILGADKPQSKTPRRKAVGGNPRAM